MNVSKLKDALIKQKTSGFKGNIYHYSQVNFAYNSNKIEGSRLSSDQTEAIYDSMSFIPKSDDVIKLDDLIETKNHFQLFDYILERIDDDITKDMLLEMHKILKRGTSDEEDPMYNVGGFKTIANVIGVIDNIKTSDPNEVEKDLNRLISFYNGLDIIELEDIVNFHYRFECIHPFSDGNGRIGRLIMFKECLKHNILPFIVLDEHKEYYKRGLKEYENDKMYLIDTIKTQQDIYENICNELLNSKEED